MKSHSATDFVGVDVASAHLDVAIHGHSRVQRFDNTAKGIVQLLRALPRGCVLGLESTGRYHAALAQAAHDRGVRVYVLNPLAKTIKADPLSHQAFERITSVPGLGLVCGSLLVMLFGRMHERSADAVIAFTGLDPRPNDSGKKTGSRRLSKRGWPEIRRLLYAAAMSAARTMTWKDFHRAQRDKGLSTTAALIVLARKLLRVAFSLFKQKSSFDSSLVAAKR